MFISYGVLSLHWDVNGEVEVEDKQQSARGMQIESKNTKYKFQHNKMANYVVTDYVYYIIWKITLRIESLLTQDTHDY